MSEVKIRKQKQWGAIAGPGHQYCVFGYYDGRKGSEGEPWFYDKDGNGYSVFDYSFEPMTRKEFRRKFGEFAA